MRFDFFFLIKNSVQKVVTLGQREVFIKINNIKEKCMNTYTYFDLKNYL